MNQLVAEILGAVTAVSALRGLHRALAARHKCNETSAQCAKDPIEWPTATVIVPAWQEKATLKHCLAALARQNYDQFDVILIAGGPDGTFEAAVQASAADSRVTVIAQGPHGKNSALNLGLRQAQGEVIVLLDADSLIRTDYLQALVRPLQGDIAAVTGNFIPFRCTPVARVGEMSKVAENKVRGRVMLNGSGGIAIRRAVLVELGGFPEGPFADDWDLSIRLALAGWRLAYSPEAAVITHRPATLQEWWTNELRWRRVHLRSVLRLSDALFTGPQAIARHLYPCLSAWAMLLGSLAAVVAGPILPARLRRATAALWAMAFAQQAGRDVTAHIEGTVYSKDPAALLALPLVPVLTGLGWLAAVLATISRGKAPLQAKGPRQPSPDPADAARLPRTGPPDPGAAISIAIVNYNTPVHLAACLNSISESCPVPVLVLDNGSTDESAELVRRNYPWVELHVLPENRGFAAGANAAVHLCRTPYVLLLNSDTLLGPNSATDLAGYLDQHPSVAIAGPRLLNPDGTLQHSCHPTPTPFNELLRWTFLGVLAARLPVGRERYLARWSHTYAKPVGWLVGAALAIRRSAFEAVGGFDESYFMYSEEVDLMFRLSKAGWQVHFAPVTEVVHTGGASTVQQRATMVAQLFISMHQFYARHYSGASLLQLKLTLSYFMVRNLVRDALHFRREPDEGERAHLDENVKAWRRVLAAVWA